MNLAKLIGEIDHGIAMYGPPRPVRPLLDVAPRLELCDPSLDLASDIAVSRGRALRVYALDLAFLATDAYRVVDAEGNPLTVVPRGVAIPEDGSSADVILLDPHSGAVHETFAHELAHLLDPTWPAVTAATLPDMECWAYEVGPVLARCQPTTARAALWSVEFGRYLRDAVADAQAEAEAELGDL